jgi:3-hydroxyisobutyrate dehydrogenase-like beta-hydroxyacid dehydrogenase
MTEAADARRLVGPVGCSTVPADALGEAELARTAKLCQNLLPGAVAASRAEINIVAQATGTSREAFLASQNKSVVGSAFTRYKPPADVNLTSQPTFTSKLLIQGVIGWLR